MVDRIPSTEQSFYNIVEQIENIIELTRGPEPIELLREGVLLPSDEPFEPVIFEGITQDEDGWINVYEYNTVSMIAGLESDTYLTGYDTPPRTFDHTVTNFSEFKAAVRDAASGATIYAAPGTYIIDEQIVLDKPVAIYGAGDATIFQAGETASSVLTFETLFWIKSSNVKLQGFKLLVNSTWTGGRHRCFFLANDYSTASLPNGGTTLVGGVPTPSTQTAGLWSGVVENIEIVNLNVETLKRVTLFNAGLANNVRLQGCNITLAVNNTSPNTGDPLVMGVHGIGGEWLVQDCVFTAVPLFPSNAYRWARPFAIFTANYLAAVNDVPGYNIVHSTAKFTVRNVTFNTKMLSLFYIFPEAKELLPIDPSSGMEICIDNCTCYVESANPTVTVNDANKADGTLISVLGYYYNPSLTATGPNLRTPYILDYIKDISVSNSTITGGERGLVYVRPLLNATFPNYTPAESAPVLLRSTDAINLHFYNNIFNRVNPQKVSEAAAGPSPWNQVFDPYVGNEFEGLFLHLEANNTGGISTADAIASEGVLPPADISRPSEGTFEIRTEYRLVQDGLALEFVPGTEIDILTEAQKEIINPRIPAVLVGVLEIRFLIRALNRLGDSFINLFGTIR